MNKIYIVQLDWSTIDCEDVELYAFNEYSNAYAKFKELISDEISETGWFSNIEFDEDGYPLDENYELEFDDNNSNESELYWRGIPARL